MTERRGDYGYDAPYALLFLAALGGAGVVASIVAWGMRDRASTPLALAGAFYLANAFSFFTRRAAGSFTSGMKSSEASISTATSASSTWVAGAVPS
jgi:hypothetical protein